jgi:protein-S-isoprenylcysteine O-methyltransferase Ste14
MIQKIFFVLSLSLVSFFVFAQSKVDMADTMRSNGKIYVVIAIILTIFAGLIFYLIRIDRKISKIEKDSS